MDGPVKSEHIGDELLEQYALERVGEPNAAGVEEHLLLCEYCRGRLEELDAYVVTLRDAISEAAVVDARPTEPVRAGGFRLFWAAGVAAVAVMGIAYLPPVRQGVAAAVAVELRAARGPGDAGAPAGAPLELTLDVAGLETAPEYRVQFADERGRITYTATARTGPRGIVVEAPPAAAGIYWVRLLDPASGELIREYGLTIGESR